MRTVGRAPIQVFVGADQGQVLGTASLMLLPNAGYVFGVATDSVARGRGIASHLTELTHLAAQRKGKPWVALDVESENETAIRVYRRLRYEEKARFDWHVGPTPTISDSAQNVTEVPKSQMKEVASWVNLNQLPAVRDVLTATGQTLSHHETITRLPNTPPAKTWKLSSSGRTIGVVRGAYLPVIKTGFVIPAAWDPALFGDFLRLLVTPAINWFRSLGATRTVVVVPDPPGAWEQALAALGLPKAVSTTLMTRRSAQLDSAAPT